MPFGDHRKNDELDRIMFAPNHRFDVVRDRPKHRGEALGSRSCGFLLGEGRRHRMAPGRGFAECMCFVMKKYSLYLYSVRQWLASPMTGEYPPRGCSAPHSPSCVAPISGEPACGSRASTLRRGGGRADRISRFLTRSWMSFRYETAFSDANARPEANDVIDYLEWAKSWQYL